MAPKLRQCKTISSVGVVVAPHFLSEEGRDAGWMITNVWVGELAWSLLGRVNRTDRLTLKECLMQYSS